MLRLRPLRLLPLRLQPLAWGGVRRGAWRAQSGVSRDAATVRTETASYTLGVKDRDDPLTEMIANLTEMIAKKIIKIAQTGVHDAAQLSALAITQLSIR